MLSVNYDNVKRIASATTKGFFKHMALAKIDKRIRKGDKTLLYLRNKLAKINFGNPYRERDYNMKPVLPSFNIEHLCHTNITNTLNNIAYREQRSSPLKTLFVTELPNANDNSYASAMRNKYHKTLFPNVNEAYLYNQIRLIPFDVQRKRPAICRKVYLNLRRIERECGLTVDDNSNNNNNSSGNGCGGDVNYRSDNKEDDELYKHEQVMTEMDWEEKWDKGLYSCNRNNNNNNNNNTHSSGSKAHMFTYDDDVIKKTLTSYSGRRQSTRRVHTVGSYSKNDNEFNDSCSTHNKKEMFGNRIKHCKTKFNNYYLLSKYNNTNMNTITVTTANNTSSNINRNQSRLKSSNILRKNKLNLIYT
jgi:hypothetical protein